MMPAAEHVSERCKGAYGNSFILDTICLAASLPSSSAPAISTGRARRKRWATIDVVAYISCGPAPRKGKRFHLSSSEVATSLANDEEAPSHGPCSHSLPLSSGNRQPSLRELGRGHKRTLSLAPLPCSLMTLMLSAEGISLSSQGSERSRTQQNSPFPC